MNKILLAAAILGSTALGMAGLTGVVGAARAQASGVTVPPANLIVGRQAGMGMQGGLLAAMKAGLASGADLKQFKDPADALAAWGKAIPGLFVPGTESGNNTKARPAVFSDQAGFAKAAGNLTDTASKLSAAAAANDKAAFTTAFQQVGQSCGACHRTYRAR